MLKTGLDGIGDLVSKNKSDPGVIQRVRHLFFKNGIGWEEFSRTPLPYIFEVMATEGWERERESKEMDKARRTR